MKFSLTKIKSKQIKGLECLNCRQPLMGHENFCSFCGQKNTVKQLSFGVFVNNLFSGFFSYDSRFWRTFIPLLTKPGKVSKEYIEGKRVRFVNPFQLYLNVSIIFFLLLGISNKIDNNNISENILTFDKNLDSISKKETKKLDTVLTNVKNQLINAIPIDSAKNKEVADINKAFDIVKAEVEKSNKYNFDLKNNDTTETLFFGKKINEFISFQKQFPKYTNTQALDSMGYSKTFWNQFYYQTVKNTNKNLEEVRAKDGGEKLAKKLTSYISISLFIFLPIFTLFLKLIYIRRKYTFMEHLVFVFHTQTVFFLLFVIFYLLSFFVEMDNVTWIFLLLFLLYLYKALRNFYKQGRIKTILKFILLNSYYMFLATVGFIIVAILSFIIS